MIGGTSKQQLRRQATVRVDPEELGVRAHLVPATRFVGGKLKMAN